MTKDAVDFDAEQRGHRLYRTVWRWHFYAGLFSIPFILWLSVTGSIYLFRPQIERWLDRPYDHLHLSGRHSTPEQIARAAVAAVPNSTLHFYELPPSDDAAVRVVVGIGTQETRVYVNPVTRKALYMVDEDKRPMVLVAHLHGQLLAGRWGSYLVELAASWAIVLLLTGLYLWWPRQTKRFAGVFWVRLGKGQRIFWRDLHAVTGVWVSALALFLILTGLPWATGWGAYFDKVRQLTGTAVQQQDWTTGRASELARRAALNHNSLSAMPGMPEMADMPDMPGVRPSGDLVPATHNADAYAPFNRLLPVAASLHLASPVEIRPAATPGGTWTIKSDAQNRTLRDIVQADPLTGSLVSRQNFDQTHWLDRILGVGIAAHEGQLFGPLNQLLGLTTAMALIVLCCSAVVLWWRRRHVGVLGAPVPLGRPRWSLALAAAVVALALYLPAFGLSLLLTSFTERLVLSRVSVIREWLGLTAT